ncbi:hypothetical protein KCP75_10210 [Salmonella enterica subsp. enterica]|nr:hypothetical protein KCP75_10210 [Salmonella enterica subsp. enterica]
MPRCVYRAQMHGVESLPPYLLAVSVQEVRALASISPKPGMRNPPLFDNSCASRNTANTEPERSPRRRWLRRVNPLTAICRSRRFAPEVRAFA